MAEIAQVRLALGDMHRQDGDLDQARDMYASAAELFSVTGSSSVVLARLNQTLMALDTGDWSAAEVMLSRIRAMPGLRLHGTMAAWTLVLEARVEASRGDEGEALARLREALEKRTLAIDEDDPDFMRCIGDAVPDHEQLLKGG